MFDRGAGKAGTPVLLGKLGINRLEPAAKDFGSAESSEIGGILDVFSDFRTARMRQKIRRPAADDLFRDSLGKR